MDKIYLLCKHGPTCFFPTISSHLLVMFSLLFDPVTVLHKYLGAVVEFLHTMAADSAGSGLSLIYSLPF